MSITEIQIQDGLLSVRQTDEGGRLRIAFAGEIDLANAKTAEQVLDQALLSGKSVLVDLGKLEFLDSTGLTMLVVALGRKEAEQLSFLPSESLEVRRLLSLTGLDRRMELRAGDSTEKP